MNRYVRLPKYLKPTIQPIDLKYRADIDGLRAIAVLSVIFFHMSIPGFSGGFVGVDVFFVISGYLITANILKDIQSEQFSLTRFYERRIRRIFPALFPVLAFTIVVATFLFDPISLESFGKSIMATTLFVSNILFWRESGYFDARSITKPLLHTWSLAVEEQFYIFFPLLLILINRFRKKQYLQWILGICIISLIWSIYGVYTYPTSTFYLPPTRVWELLFGSLLSLEVIPELKSKIHRNIVSIIGLGLIVFSVSLYTDVTPFPGISALIPVMGTILIIYGGMGNTSIVTNLLSLKPIVFIGLISYSLYLWHWPLIAFSKYLVFRDLTLFEITGIILTSFLISVLSFRFIEQPFRGTNPIIPSRKKLFVFSVAVMTFFSLIGIVYHLTKGIPSRKSEVKSYIMDYKTDGQWINAGKDEKIVDGLHKGNIPPLIGVSGGIPSFLIWGDSHARSLFTSLSDMGKKYGLSGYIISKSGIMPLLGMCEYIPVGDSYAYKYNQYVIDFINDHPEIKTVIIAGYWNYKVSLIDITGEYKGISSYSFLLRVGLLRTVNTVLKMGRNVVLVSDVPKIKSDPNRIIYVSQRFNTEIDFKQIATTFDDYQKLNNDVIMIFNEIEKYPNVTIVHPESMFFDKNGNSIVMSDKKILYMDTNHLSTEGSRFVSPVFDDLFKKMKH